jgi:class 3 adenylate cyclase
MNANMTLAEPLLFLKIGIHSGASIAVTLNDRLDYFGQTVNVAARIQGLAGASEIYISHQAHNQPDVQSLLTHCDVIEEQVALKGVRNKIDVCKIVLRKEDSSG